MYKGELVNEKINSKEMMSVCNVIYIMEQSIKMHVISMMPWQAGWVVWSLESGQCTLQALVHRLEFFKK
jgi:hypothetical protein